MTGHDWCHCTTVPCGVGLVGHEGHCCLRGDCTDTSPGDHGWLVAHQHHCERDHSVRIADLARKAAS